MEGEFLGESAIAAAPGHIVHLFLTGGEENEEESWGEEEEEDGEENPTHTNGDVDPPPPPPPPELLGNISFCSEPLLANA